MFCAVCLKCLRSHDDPSSVEVVATVGNIWPPEKVTPLTESQKQRHESKLSDPRRRFDRIDFAYGHHKTPESFLKSAREGCPICSSLPVRTEYTEDMATFGYFTMFNICVSLESHAGKISFMMYIICENQSFNRYGQFWPYSATQRHFNNMISEFTDSPNTWATIRHWIKSCDDKHTLCKVQSTFIPTRLLKVDTSGGKQTFRLVLREEVEAGSDYLALSHCWGTKSWDLDLTLRASTLADLSRGKPLSILPKTFRDAFVALERLELQYIWIDRLCIFQDSEADWSQESSSMHQVFKNAFLCIAALDADNDEGGLYFARNPRDIKPSVIDVSLYGKPDSYVNEWEIFQLHQRSLDNAILCKRGWILQERVLSPRTIYWGKQQVLWECHEMHCSESQPDPDWLGTEWGAKQYLESIRSSIQQYGFKTLMPQWPKGPLRGSSELHYSQWRELLQSYTKCQLTKPRDKLVAISAIAKQTKDYLEALSESSRYLAGIWEANLPWALAWRVHSDSVCETRPFGYRAPSWSWAAVDGEILSPLFLSLKVPLAKTISAQTALLTGDETGQITDGTIALESAVLPAIVGTAASHAERWTRTKAETYRKVAVLNSQEPEPPSMSGSVIEFMTQGSIHFDTLDEICANVYFIPIYWEHESVIGLGLVPEEGKFRRVGRISIAISTDEETSLKLLDQLPRRTVVIG